MPLQFLLMAEACISCRKSTGKKDWPGKAVPIFLYRNKAGLTYVPLSHSANPAAQRIWNFIIQITTFTIAKHSSTQLKQTCSTLLMPTKVLFFLEEASSNAYLLLSFRAKNSESSHSRVGRIFKDYAAERSSKIRRED